MNLYLNTFESFMQRNKDIELLIKLAIDKYFEGDPDYYYYSSLARRLALHKRVRLRFLPLVCRKCGNLLVGSNAIVRIRKGFKTIKCNKCGYSRKVYVKAS